MARTVHVEVLHNAGQLKRWLNDQERKQLPFANALALTRTAQAAQRDTRESIPRRFKLRARGMPRAAVRIRPASKHDWPHQEASVGVTKKFRFLADHEEGTVRRPSKGHRLTIPMAIKRTSRGKIPKAKTPTRMREKKSVYVDDENREIRRRPPRRGARDRRMRLYLLRPAVRIRKRLGMKLTTRMAVQREHRKQFRAAWKKAMGKGGDRKLLPE